MSKPGEFTHTRQSDARIKNGYATNEPIASIAASLGLTRNAVIGRANRIGLARSWRTKLGYELFRLDLGRVGETSRKISNAMRVHHQRKRGEA